MYTLGLIDEAVKNGATYEELAEAFGLGTTYNFDSGWRYNYKRKPELNTLILMGKRFGKPPLELFSGPQDGDELTQATRELEGMMGSDDLSKLTNDMKISAYRAGKAAMLAIAKGNLSK